MKGDRADGWHEAPASPVWVCPECKVPSDPDEWEETEAGCEDCGSHDGRRCPNPECEEVLDHVWGSADIADETHAYLVRRAALLTASALIPAWPPGPSSPWPQGGPR